MTKTNTALLAALLLNEELANNEAMVQFITTTLEDASKKTNNKEHPNYTDDDGQEFKWCIRHEQYEKIEGWKVGTNGRLDASCDIAVHQWRELTKELKKLEKMTTEYLGDAEKLQNHMMMVESKRTERAGKYDFPEGAAETKEAAAEEAEVITPKKRRTKKEVA